MSQLVRRNSSVLLNSSGSLAPGASYTITAYEVGGVASANSSGGTISVYAGHGIAALDRIMVGTTASTFWSVSSVTATTVVVGSAVSVTAGDYIVNLGPDTGSSTPNWDGSGVTVYSTPTTATAVTQSRVTADSNGNYGYWWRGEQLWELARTAARTAARVITDITGVGVTRVTAIPATGTLGQSIVYFNGTLDIYYVWMTGTAGDDWTEVMRAP